MNPVLLVLIGFIIGGFVVAWMCWSYLHSRFNELEEAVHERFTSFETFVSIKLRELNPPRIPSPAPAAAVAPAPVATAAPIASPDSSATPPPA